MGGWDQSTGCSNQGDIIQNETTSDTGCEKDLDTIPENSESRADIWTGRMVNNLLESNLIVEHDINVNEVGGSTNDEDVKSTVMMSSIIEDIIDVSIPYICDGGMGDEKEVKCTLMMSSSIEDMVDEEEVKWTSLGTL